MAYGRLKAEYWSLNLEIFIVSEIEVQALDEFYWVAN